MVAFLRERGIRLVIYLDDMLVMNQCKTRLAEEAALIVGLLQSLGFVMNQEKSDFGPSQSMVFLGYGIDTLGLALSLPPEKKESMVSLCKKLARKGSVSLRDLASVLGKFEWASAAVPNARSRFRALQQLYIEGLGRAGGNLQLKVALGATARAELEWWAAGVPNMGGRSFVEEVPVVVVSSDACLTGWGAECNDVTTGGRWTKEEIVAYRHINELELLAAFNGLRAFAAHLQGATVRVRMDNTTAVSYVNRQGGSRSGPLNDLAVRIIRWAEERQLTIEAVYLPGALNFVADKESRRDRDWSDWKLCSAAFSMVSSRWQVQVDLFSMPWNAQLDRFVCWLPQPEAVGTDAMTVDWKSIKGYAFPPFALIGQCLTKLRKEGADLVLVCPYWPSQPWFPTLLQLTTDVPLVLPRRADLLTNGLGEPHPLSTRLSFRLIAWPLSGDASRSEAFRRRWSTFSWPAAETRPSPLTNPPGGLGLLGVLNGVKIPCMAA